MSDDSDAGHWVLSSKKNARQIEELNTCLQVMALEFLDVSLTL